MLCAYAFPMCVVNDGVTSKLPLCYEDCVATHKQFCYNDWALIEDKRRRECSMNPEDIFDCRIARNFHDTIDRRNHQLVRMSD